MEGKGKRGDGMEGKGKGSLNAMDQKPYKLHLSLCTCVIKVI